MVSRSRRYTPLLPIFATALVAAGCGKKSEESSGDESASGVSSIGDSASTDDGTADGGETGDSNDSSADGGEKLDVAGADDTGGEDGGPPLEPCEEAAEAKSNQGCEFWAVDLPNVWDDPFSSFPAAEDMQFAVVVANTSSDDDANVGVFQGNSTNISAAATLAPGGTHEFLLPALNIEPRNSTTNGVAWRIQSDLPITAYQFNPLDNANPVFSNDASLLLPTHVLAEDYTAVTGDGIQLNTGSIVDNAGSFISMVATEDGTSIQAFPTTTIYGASTTATINRGAVWTIVSNNSSSATAGQGNLSGTRITADKPIAVFSGNVATIEPQPVQGTLGCCADHMEHQMPPLVAWGNAYAAAPVPAPALQTASGSDRTAYRITGGYDGTSLQYSPAAPAGAPTSINAYQTVRFETNQAFTVRTTDPDKAFTITQFILSGEAARGTPSPIGSNGHPGDPGMIVIPAAAQFQDRYIFLVPQGYEYNYVTIYRPEGAFV
ncbi:MAG: IgGFc-binding protein, partial [Nannocystaceae bacterium]